MESAEPALAKRLPRGMFIFNFYPWNAAFEIPMYIN